MNKKSRFLGKLINRNHNQNIEVNVDVVEYDENDIFYVYCPAFDLIGYGKTQQEARESWELVLEEYFKYALNKKTLIRDLEERGWSIRKKKDYIAPTFSWMLKNNEQLSEVYNNHDFHKTTRPITVPLHEACA